MNDSTDLPEIFHLTETESEPISDDESKSRWSRRLIVLFGIAVTLLGLYALGVSTESGNLPRKASVHGIAIGGMSPQAAEAALAAGLKPYMDEPVKLTAHATSVEVTYSTSGVSVDIPATVQQLTEPQRDPIALIWRFIGTVHALPIVKVDEPALQQAVIQANKTLTVEANEPTITFAHGSAQVTAGTAGTQIDISEATKRLKELFLTETHEIVLQPTPKLPTVTDVVAQAALPIADVAYSEPITLTFGDEDLVISQEQVGKLVSFVGIQGQMSPVVDDQQLHLLVDPIVDVSNHKPVDASFTIVHDVPHIVPAKSGFIFSTADIIKGVLTAIADPNARTVAIANQEVQAAFTTDDAKKLGIKEKLSSFTQNFPYAAYRVQNIGQAAKYLDGTIVAPGATFSMNDTVHERTPANGYTVGYIVGPGGVFRQELGGGVSTATTTVWTAAFYANMTKVEQRAHSIWISRYEPGLEATVSWGSLDLKWKNPEKTAVLIKASITDSSVTVSLYGTKHFRSVEKISGPWYNIKPFGKATSSAAGCEPQAGVNGFDIVVTRKVTDLKGAVHSQDFKTHYDPTPVVTCK